MGTLQDEVQEIVDGLLREPLQPPASLRSLVEAHLEGARAASLHHALLDMKLATEVARACLALLGDWERLDDAGRLQVQVACTYFAQSGDDEDDFSSMIGFVDDAEVVNHVAAGVGRADLCIDLS